MKNKQIYISIFFSVTILFFSCRQNENKQADFIPDSLIKATEGIAIGKAKFGISEKEFNQLYPDSLVDLDGNLYNVSTYFDSSKALNKVYLIDTATIDNTKFGEALFDRMDLLKQHFMKTYGVPQYDRGYPKQDKMQNGKAFDAYMWKVGKKKIFVGIALEETDRGNIYYVVAHVDRK
ncbi:hypothetical protein [Pedobacter sp. Leaf176]|uniref:hypothetical protein n=1 Tax=Pedobacter sp. Leaf176 TaxID=1736286 RepID=UPI0006FCDE13|nr:hypothetical protein [Pedobacter sp. Leaf176]KQR65333.1 hypothetical protein ASF92_20605 [Pedobacter sp. Leaf176]